MTRSPMILDMIREAGGAVPDDLGHDQSEHDDTVSNDLGHDQSEHDDTAPNDQSEHDDAVSNDLGHDQSEHNDAAPNGLGDNQNILNNFVLVPKNSFIFDDTVTECPFPTVVVGNLEFFCVHESIVEKSHSMMPLERMSESMLGTVIDGVTSDFELIASSTSKVINEIMPNSETLNDYNKVVASEDRDTLDVSGRLLNTDENNVSDEESVIIPNQQKKRRKNQQGHAFSVMQNMSGYRNT